MQPERGEVPSDIPGPARHGGFPRAAHDRHRGLGRDAGDVAIDEAVEHDVADADDFPARSRLRDQVYQGCARHQPRTVPAKKESDMLYSGFLNGYSRWQESGKRRSRRHRMDPNGPAVRIFPMKSQRFRKLELPAASAPIIVWFREDLRLSDNPAVHAAVQTRPSGNLPRTFTRTGCEWRRVVWAARRVGGWTSPSKRSLRDLEQLGGRLTVRAGDGSACLDEVDRRDRRRHAVYWSRRYGKAPNVMSDAAKSKRT
jgi:hypothetical protein